jgi:hypothetical protein
MKKELELMEDEFLELDLLIRQALDSARVELHHTVTFAYKDRVKERIERLERILANFEKGR